MEIRLHGRGGQGGVTCAKILAAMYGRLGKSVQTFGDYAGERSGAPIRAYTRISDTPITNRNKVYQPDHLIVLEESLLNAAALAGFAAGGTLLLNTAADPEAAVPQVLGCRLAAVDATAIARKHKIGTRSVVIVNTTLAGAWARIFDVPIDVLEGAYADLGLERDLPAAHAAWQAVRVVERSGERIPAEAAPAPPVVEPLVEHIESAAPPILTGSWRSQQPFWNPGRAPCNAACPAGNDVVGFVQALYRDDEAAAAAVLARTNPLPGVCGWLCPAPCMTGCNRGRADGAVNVRGLERRVAEFAPLPQVEPMAPEPRHVAVVGGGVSGLSAAWTIRQAGHHATIYEAGEELGGSLLREVEEGTLPAVALAWELESVVRSGVAVEVDRPIDGAALQAIEADAVVVTGGEHAAELTDGRPLVDSRTFGKPKRSVAHGIGAGRRAALHALDALDVLPEALRDAKKLKTVGHASMRHEHFAPAPAASLEPAKGEVADACEAARCYSCGTCTLCDQCLVYCPEGIVRREAGGYVADLEYCKGCGICAVECPRGAVQMG